MCDGEYGMVRLNDIGFEDEEEDSSSSEQTPQIGEATEPALSCAPMTEKLVMDRTVSRKAIKRAKPAVRGKKRQPAKKPKISPVVPSPPQSSESPPSLNSLNSDTSPSQKADSVVPSESSESAFVGEQPSMPDFVMVDSLLIHEDTYLGEKSIPCFCQLPRVIPEGYRGCEDGCVNRASKVECGSRCPTGQYCGNKMFQKKEYAPVEAFYCGPQKGWGVRAVEDIQEGSFIMEYVGELIGQLEYYRRRWIYGQQDHRHHYFMTAGHGDVIDATKYGSISRFINHSCNPNCETAKWMVKKRCRVGFFAKRLIKKGEEIVFNYQFRSAGEPQKCFCGAPNCQGVIGSQQAARAERDSDSESDIDFAELDPTKVVEGGSSVLEKEKPKKKKLVKRVKRERKRATRGALDFEDVTTEELDEFDESGAHLRNADHVMAAVKLMLRLDRTEDRIRFLKAILECNSEASNLWRLFIENEVVSILFLWFHPDAIRNSEYLLNLVAFASLVPLTDQKQVRDSGLLERIDKILHDSQEDIVKDVLELLLDEICLDGVETIRQQARAKLATLFEKWSNLKVFNKIPKKERVENAAAQVDERSSEYEMRSFLRPSYIDPLYNGSQQHSSTRVSTLRTPGDYGGSRSRFSNFHNSNNANESPPNDVEQSDDEIPFRSVIGYVNLPTLNLLESVHRERPARWNTFDHARDTETRNQSLFVEEGTESVSPTPLTVGPHTPSEPPTNEDLTERENDFPMTSDSANLRRTNKRKSRFDMSDGNMGSTALPRPTLVNPSTSQFNHAVVAATSAVPSPSPSISASSLDQKYYPQSTPTPSFPPSAMAYPPPTMNPMMAPPVNLEIARQQLALYKAHIAYLTAYIEHQEAAIRPPAKDLDSRLHEFIIDVNLPKPDASAEKESDKTVPEEAHPSAVASCSSQSQEVATVSSHPKRSSKPNAASAEPPTFSLEVRAKFKADIVKFVQSILEPYRKRCFKSSDDFKYLTRKLTHTILEKEEKNCEDLRVTDSVRKKAKDYVMSHVKKFENGQYSKPKTQKSQ